MTRKHLSVSLAVSITGLASTALAQGVPGGPGVAPLPPVVIEVAPAPQARWYDKVALEAFVDAYASVNYGFPKPETGKNAFRALDVTNGFAIQWVGLDASFAPEPVGGTVNVRLGPGASLLGGADAAVGLGEVKQAFASWRPGGPEGKLTIDFGKYGAPYGSESGDSQRSINYTRGILARLAPPGFFTGLRLDYAASRVLDVKLLIANGWNNSVDLNRGKSLGLQLNLAPSDKARFCLGYVVGPEQADAAVETSGGVTRVVNVDGANKRFRHFVDAVIDLRPTARLQALFNADFGTEKLPSGRATWYGANAAVRYAFSDTFASGLRAEYFRDTAGFTTATRGATGLASGTLTLDYRPSPHLILKLDQRVDYATEGGALFARGLDGSSRTQITTTLGVVATTD